MTLALLPPVDPHYLLEEDDPETLHAYARGLLTHLRNMSDGASNAGYPKETIKAAAVWLIGAYVTAATPPCAEAATLIAALIDPKPQASSLSITKVDAYWEAIFFEAGFPADESEKQPSTASTYRVAKHVCRLLDTDSQDSAEGTVKAWRKRVHYRDNVALYRNGKEPTARG